jgi:hypothetical protein
LEGAHAIRTLIARLARRGAARADRLLGLMP